MRKRVIEHERRAGPTADQNWLDLEHLAQVEVTSESSESPVEGALLPAAGGGWCAGRPGRQTIRLLFDEPQRVSRIHLLFREDQHQRTQEFVLRASADNGRSFREITRQQYNFSPPHTTEETEDYTVDLGGLTTLELEIVPDISGGDAVASLHELRLG